MPKDPMTPRPDEAGRFHTTRWTCVLAAKGDSDEAKSALSDLCETYYEPVHAFIRATESGDSARDLTHAFFASILERPSLERLEREGGKFRSYLLGAVKHFLSDHRKKRMAEKRGGGTPDESLDAVADDGVENARSFEPPDDALFDRQWALAVLARAAKDLAESSDNPEKFQVLKPWLNGDNPNGISQAEAAAKLGMSEGAVKVAIHRLRMKMRALVKAEIAQTLETSNETRISEELDYLIRASR